MLLIRAEIESNPGPEEFFCCICAKRLISKSTSIRCTTCNGWSHLRACSGRGNRESTTSYVAPCCQRTTPINVFTAVARALGSRNVPSLQGRDQQRLKRSPEAQLRSMTPILTDPSRNLLPAPTPVREPQGNSLFLAPCARPHTFQ